MLRQKFEKRVGRPRDQHVVARIRQQLEQVGVRFAGAGRQQDAAGRNPMAARGIIIRHGLARFGRAGGLRIVTEDARVRESLDDLAADTPSRRAWDSIR